MVGAAQVRGPAGGRGHHRGGVVAADVEEGAQHAVVPAHQDDRLAGDLGGDVLPGRGQLVGAGRQQPAAGEHRLPLALRPPGDRCTSGRGW